MMKYSGISGIATIILLVAPLMSHADALTPTSCDSLFGLPAGTISTSASAQYLNPTTCAAYQYLLTRYHGGSQGTTGLANPSIQGITKLNPTFATNLANMMHAADAAGYRLIITSAYRTCAGQLLVNPHGYGGNCDAAIHTKGLAVDFGYPDGGSKYECTGAAHDWLHQNAASYHIGLYNDLHSFVQGECNHVEATSGSTNGALGPGTAGGTAPAAIPQTVTAPTVTSPQGYPASPVAGQIVSQDTYCIISTNPLYTIQVPAGTAYPAGCLSGTQSTLSSSMLQPYCSGNTLLYNNGGSLSGQLCPYGCSNGICMQAPQAASQASPYANPASAATNGTSASNGSTASGVSTGSTASTPSLPISPLASSALPSVTTSAIASPTLLPTSSTGTASAGSTTSLMQLLATTSPGAQAKSTGPGASSSTVVESTFALGAAGTNITQLQGQVPSVSFLSTGASIASGGLLATTSQSNPATGGLISQATVGSSNASASSINPPSSPYGTSTSGAAPNDTFISNDLAAQSPSSGTAPATAGNAPGSSPLSILSDLENKLIGALQFLISFGSTSQAPGPGDD